MSELDVLLGTELPDQVSYLSRRAHRGRMFGRLVAAPLIPHIPHGKHNRSTEAEVM